jgi:LDH2 family malate/lactate/ureidoglycolate dehydrogenase
LEAGLSQVFLAINPAALGDEARLQQIADEIIASLHQSRAAEEGKKLRYPGERVLQIRAENRSSVFLEREVEEIVKMPNSLGDRDFEDVVRQNDESWRPRHQGRTRGYKCANTGSDSCVYWRLCWSSLWPVAVKKR